eukprot:4754960-Prymnesium_polylepis.1
MGAPPAAAATALRTHPTAAPTRCTALLPRCSRATPCRRRAAAALTVRGARRRSTARAVMQQI